MDNQSSDPKVWAVVCTIGIAVGGWVWNLARKIGSMVRQIDQQSEEILIIKESACVGGTECDKLRGGCRSDMLRELDAGDDRMCRIEGKLDQVIMILVKIRNA